MTQLAKLTHINLTIENRKVLQDISFTLEAGKILTIIGPNGAGKSTLLKILLGLRLADSGTVWKKDRLRIGYVPQKISMSPLLPMTVKRFLEINQQHKNDSLKILDELNITYLQNQSVQTLSGGELQRVLLGRALLNKPELLVLDEPAQGVDVSGQNELYQLINNVKDTLGCGVLLVSHDLHLVMSSADQVLCLNQHVCCHGKPESVSKHPEYLKLFGNVATQHIAVYTHHHDHEHDLDGRVCDQNCPKHHQHPQRAREYPHG
jgi:zinc transport system ATP-binding protein